LAKLQANLAAQWVVVDESDPELQASLGRLREAWES